MFSVITAPGNFSTHGIQDFSKGLLHVFGLINFIISVRCVKPQNRYAILIDHIRIYFAKAVPSGNGFSAASHAYMCPKKIPVIFLQGSAVAASFFWLSMECKSAGH